jgi:hypothetical protein
MKMSCNFCFVPSFFVVEIKDVLFVVLILCYGGGEGEFEERGVVRRRKTKNRELKKYQY